ncbi:acyltransferase [Alginatibacterium sediminis]|uniref:Acyltransferase n=2 Tax=Alginatibacterium sediminis TaxID=2164068 RepID=A0A420EE35_9ALTE|nr:acyltransferase [Alginatibacterium sediminis]
MIANTRVWLKHSQHPLAQFSFKQLKAIRQFNLPKIPLIFDLCYRLWVFASSVVTAVLRVLWWTPLFRGQTQGTSRRLYLYGGIPLLGEGLVMQIGDDCRISAHTTFSGRSEQGKPARLSIGNNVDIGWQCTIAVGTKVTIADNVRIAQGCFIAGYSGHPLQADLRAAGHAEPAHSRSSVVLERDVWLASKVSVLPGVTIGQGTVVATGSIVTRSLPDGVLAAGIPAKVIRKLEDSSNA